MNIYCKSALHQIEVAVTTIVEMIEKLTENDLQKRPTPNKQSIGELLEHIAIICEADSLISDGASQDKLNKFYSSVSYKSLNEIKEALIKNHQFLENKIMNFTEVELQEEVTCKVMIYESPDETFVFLYNTIQDTSCFADMCFEVLEEAEEYCEKFGINNEGWLFIDDPLDGCQDDIINSK